MSKEYLGKEIKKLGFGFMRLPVLSGVTDIDFEQTKAMVDHYMAQGYTYFDTAVPYHGQHSEAALKKCLVDRYPRESFQIATKLSKPFLNENYSIAQQFQDSLEKIGVDYVDYYLLHAMDRDRVDYFAKTDAWEFVQEMKAQGKIKHVGFSFHDKAQVLEEILLAHPEMEFVQLQLNYADWDNEMIQSKKCYEIALAHEKSIIVMEPIRGGMLASLPAEAEAHFQNTRPQDSLAKWALRFVGGLDNIITILSGMSTLDQVKENVDTFNSLEPLTTEDHEIIKKVVEVLDSMPSIPCTDCKYCVEDCPAKINIPAFFRTMNIHYRYDGADAKPTNPNSFRFLTAKGQAKPSACVACGKCEKHCPQGIKIIEDLKLVAKAYET